MAILSGLKHKPEALTTAEELLQSAMIQLEEAIHEIESHIDRFEADPQRLQQVEERLSAIFQLSRKHRVNADQLVETLESLGQNWQNLRAVKQVSITCKKSWTSWLLSTANRVQN